MLSLMEQNSSKTTISHCVCVCVCVYHTLLSLYIHPSTDTQIVSISWLLSIVLQWTCESRHLFEVVILFPLDIDPEVELLDGMVVL